MSRFLLYVILTLLFHFPICGLPQEKPAKLFWWSPDDSTINFGDYLSKVLVERIVGKSIETVSFSHPNERMVLGIGSIIHFAEENDVIWGSGFGSQSPSNLKFKHLDVRAVRGPLTRQLLLEKGIPCPEIYGDPALLLPLLLPEFKREEILYDYIIIPHISEMFLFLPYKNVVYPTEPWNEILNKILKAKLVISSSLHGIILAEAFGIPARLLVMNCDRRLFKYCDYYQGTGRTDFHPANSVHEALNLGGESPPQVDLTILLNSFPYDCIPKK